MRLNRARAGYQRLVMDSSSSLPGPKPTSPDAVGLVRELCALWSRGELEPALALIHPDARWELSGRFIGSRRTYRGPAGVAEFWEVFREPWKDISLEPLEFTEVDETRLLSRARFRGTGRASGVVTETELFVIWTVDDGKVAGYRSFAERDQALGAAGLG
jgi:ketosteroid isomerase-like protein